MLEIVEKQLKFITIYDKIVTIRNISRRNVMIRIAVELFADNGITKKLYGIGWGENEFCFTENRAEAENLLCLLEENGVEENQIAHVIEDLFYT